MVTRKELCRKSSVGNSAGIRYSRYLSTGFINMPCIGMLQIKGIDAKREQEYIELYELPFPDCMYCVGAWYSGGKHDTQIWPIGWLHRNKKQLLPPPSVNREEIYNGKKVVRKVLKNDSHIVKRKMIKRTLLS